MSGGRAANGTCGEISFEARVRREVWESLVSMLHVYASAASMGRGEFAVTSASDAPWVRHNGRTLGLRFNAADGLASWRMTAAGGQERRASFQILPTGALISGGEEKELDQAALEWIEELAGEGAQS